MSYEVRITGLPIQAESHVVHKIDAEQWRRVVECDVEMKLVGDVEVTAPTGEVLAYKNPLLATWLGHPQQDSVVFDFRQGAIIVKNPDAFVLRKMRELALLLNAHVQGEEGQCYDEMHWAH